MSGWRLEPAKNGKPALVRPDGSWCESRFKPDLDAARRVEDAGIVSGDRVLLVGAGGGELPRAILRRIGEGRLVIAEPEAAIVALLASSDATRDIWTDPRVRVITMTSAPHDDGVCAFASPRDFLRALVDCDYSRYLVHPGLSIPHGLEPLQELLADLEIRRRSGRHFAAEMTANLAANRSRFLAAPGVGELRGALAGGTVIVAGGGPSLAGLAAAIGADADWIAVGTALKPLLALGIRPHLVVITDPQQEVAEQLAPGAPPLVTFPTTARDAVRAAGRLVAAFASSDGGEALAPLRAEVGELPAAGTVSSSAIGLAALLGARCIALAGVDLVEAEGESHARGSVHEERELGSIDRFTSRESRRRARIAVQRVGPGLTVPTADGGTARTRPNLALYARALERLFARYHDIEFCQLAGRSHLMRGVTLTAVEKLSLGRHAFEVPDGSRVRRHAELFDRLMG